MNICVHQYISTGGQSGIEEIRIRMMNLPWRLDPIVRVYSHTSSNYFSKVLSWLLNVYQKGMANHVGPDRWKRSHLPVILLHKTCSLMLNHIRFVNIISPVWIPHCSLQWHTPRHMPRQWLKFHFWGPGLNWSSLLKLGWLIDTRQLSYRKEDRAMHPIYGCPEKFWESSLRTRLLFQKFVMGFCTDRY